MNKLALEITDLNKNYNNNLVLKNISFKINQNDFVGLVGVNGAGKSTLIKSILDFISIDSGNIEIYNTSHRVSLSRQKISFLPEKFSPPLYLTGNQFFSYTAGLNNIELKKTNVVEILKILDLDLSILNKTIGKYSKGMAQKLGLAACFLSQRPFFIFDEPMSGLDPKARSFLKQYLLFLRDKGKTLFFSTHLLDDVSAVCNKIIILHKSKICFNGTLKECCEKYNKKTLEESYLACIGA